MLINEPPDGQQNLFFPNTTNYSQNLLACKHFSSSYLPFKNIVTRKKKTPNTVKIITDVLHDEQDNVVQMLWKYSQRWEPGKLKIHMLKC